MSNILVIFEFSLSILIIIESRATISEKSEIFPLPFQFKSPWTTYKVNRFLNQAAHANLMLVCLLLMGLIHIILKEKLNKTLVAHKYNILFYLRFAKKNFVIKNIFTKNRENKSERKKSFSYKI